MFKKATGITKRIQRGKSVAVKTLYRIEVHKVTFPKFKQTSLTSDSEVSICFERGGKIAASHDRGLTDLRDGSAEVVFNETLSLVVTMYKGPNDKYQEKIGKLIIRQKRRALLGGDYKGLGVAEINLTEIIENYCQTPLSLPVGQCASSGVFVHITVTPKVVGEEAADEDDGMSQHSDFSDGGDDGLAVTESFDRVDEKPNVVSTQDERPVSISISALSGDDRKSDMTLSGPSLSSRLSAALSANAVMSADLQSLKTRYDFLLEENEAMKTETVDVILKLQAKCRESDDRAGSLQVELDDCLEYIQAMTAKNTELQNQVDTVMSQQVEAASAAREANEKNELLLEVYSNLSKTNSEKIALETRVAELEQLLNEAQQIVEQSGKNRSMSAPLGSSSASKSTGGDDTEMVKKEREVISLKSQIKKLKESETQFEEALQKSVNEREVLLSAKVKSESEVRLSKDKIQRLKTALAATKQELVELKEMVGGLEGIDAYKDLLESRNNLERDLATLKEESEGRLREHKVASAHIVSLMSEKMDLQKQLESAQSSLATVDSEKSSRRRELSSLRDENSRLEQLVQKLEADVACGLAAQEEKVKLEKSVASLQDEKNRMVNKVLGLHNENSELKQRNHTTQAELVRMQKSLQALTASSEELEKRCEVLQKEKFEQSQHMENTYTAKEEVLLVDLSLQRAASQSLEAEKQSLETTVSALEGSNLDLEKRVRELVAELSDCKGAASRAEQERIDVQGRLIEVEHAKAMVDAAYAVLNTEVLELRTTLQELHAQYANVRDRSDVEIENSELRQRIALLQSQVSQNEADMVLLKTKNAKRRESISSLQQFIDTERRGYQQQSENVDDIKRSFAQLQETCRQQEESINLLRKREARLTTVDRQAALMAKEADELRMKLQTALADLTTLREESSLSLQAWESERETLLGQLSSAEEEAKRHAERVVALEGEILIIEQSHSGMRDELADQTKRLNSLQTVNDQLENGIANLRSERQSNAKLIALLQKDLKQAETSLSHCKIDNDSLHNKVLRLDDEVFAMQNKVEPLRTELARVEKSVAFLNEDKAKMQQTVASLRDERYKLEERLISMEEEKNSLETEITSLNEEKVELQRELEERTAEVRSMMARRVSIEGANEAMGVAVTVEKRIKEVLIEDRKRLQECVNVLELEKEELLDDINVLRDDISALNEELVATKSAHEKCKKDYERLRSEKNEWDLHRDRLESDRLELQAEINQLLADQAKMEDLIHHHTSQTSTIIPNMGVSFQRSASAVSEGSVAKQISPSTSIRYTTPDGAVVEPTSDIYAGMMQLSDELVAARSTIMSLQERIDYMTRDMNTQQQLQNAMTEVQQRADASRDEFVSRMDTLLSHIVSLEQEVEDKASEISLLRVQLEELRTRSNRIAPNSSASVLECDIAPGSGSRHNSDVVTQVDILDQMILQEEVASLKAVIAQRDSQIQMLCLPRNMPSYGDSYFRSPTKSIGSPSLSVHGNPQKKVEFDTSVDITDGDGIAADDVDHLVRESRGGFTFGFDAAHERAQWDAYPSEGCRDDKTEEGVVSEDNEFADDERFTLGIRDSIDIAAVGTLNCEYNEEETDLALAEEENAQLESQQQAAVGAGDLPNFTTHDSEAMQAMLSSLIQTKLEAASLATECDAERKKVSLLRIRVKWYEEKVAKSDETNSLLKTAREEIEVLTKSLADKDLYISKLLFDGGADMNDPVIGNEAREEASALAGRTDPVDDIDALVLASRGGIRPSAAGARILRKGHSMPITSSHSSNWRDSAVRGEGSIGRFSSNLRDFGPVLPDVEGEEGHTSDPDPFELPAMDYNEQEEDDEDVGGNVLMSQSQMQYGDNQSSLQTMQQMEMEINDLVSLLIDSKMEAATALTECDAERKKVFLLRARVQKYAEKLSAMEVTNAELSSRLQQMESTSRQSTSMIPMISYSRGEVLYSGVLIKRGSRFPSWLRRHFELTSFGLFYFDVKDRTCKGEFLLTPTTTLQSKSFLMHQHCFCLTSNRRVLYLNAESEESKTEWMRMLTTSIAKLTKRMSLGDSHTQNK